MKRALLLLLLAGCPVQTGGGTPTTCKKQFAKCKLPTGPLGVCDLVPCEDGGHCLKCQPQH